MYTGFVDYNQTRLEDVFETEYGEIVAKYTSFDPDNLFMDVKSVMFSPDILFTKLLILKDYKNCWRRYAFTTDLFYRVHLFQKSLDAVNEGCYHNLDRYCKNIPYRDKIEWYINDKQDTTEELAIVADKDIIEEKMKDIDDSYKELVRTLISTDDKYRLIAIHNMKNFLTPDNDNLMNILKIDTGKNVFTVDIPNVFETLLKYKGESYYE